MPLHKLWVELSFVCAFTDVYTVSRSSNNTISFNIVKVQCWLKKWICSLGHCLCGVCTFSPHLLWSSGFLPRPKDVLVRWMVSQCERVGVGAPCDGRASCPGAGPPLVPWAAGTDSGHPWPWTGISDWKITTLLVFINCS